MPTKKTREEKIKELMDAKGISQSELARRSGVDRSQLNRCIRHGIALQPYQIVAIAKVLGVSPDDLGVEVTDEARHMMAEFDAALARAAAAEAECVQLKEQLNEATAQVDVAKQEAAKTAETYAARVAAAREQAEAGHRIILDAERARLADELHAAVEAEKTRSANRIAALEDEAARLRDRVNIATMAATRHLGERNKWISHAAALKAQLDKKNGDVIGVGVLAALGGLMLADNKPRRRR